MFESKNINGHPWSIGSGDPDSSKRGEDATLTLMSDLPEDVQRQVSDWRIGKLWSVIPQTMITIVMS